MSEFEGVDLTSLQSQAAGGLLGGRIRYDQLSADYYGLKIQGPPGEFAVSFASHSFKKPN